MQSCLTVDSSIRILNVVAGTQTIPALGVKGSVVEANSGWMRHKLFPQGRAVYATPENIEQFSLVGKSGSQWVGRLNE